MVLYNIFNQTSFALHIASILFGLLFYKKYNNLLSREHVYITLSMFLNYFVVTRAYSVLRSLPISHAGYELIYIIGFVGILYTTIITTLILKREFYIVTNRTHLIKNGFIIFALIIVPIVFTVMAMLINDKELLHALILVVLILSLIFLLINVIFIGMKIGSNEYKVKSINLKYTVKIVVLTLCIFYPLIILAMVNILFQFLKIADFKAYIQNSIDVTNMKSMISNYSFQIFHILFGIYSVFSISKLFFKPKKQLEEYLTIKFIKKNELTTREIEIIQYLLSGLKNSEICQSLFIAKGTLKNHIRNIYQKCKVQSRQELISLIKEEPET